jgi:hypothetical protein
MSTKILTTWKRGRIRKGLLCPLDLIAIWLFKELQADLFLKNEQDKACSES